MKSINLSVPVVLALALAGCGGGGATSGGGSTGSIVAPTTTTPTTPRNNPSIVDPKTDGATVGQTLAAGTTLSSRYLATSISKARNTGEIMGLSTDVGLTDNGLGGYDFSLHSYAGRYGPSARVTMIAADQVPGSKDSWQREWVVNGSKYSLSLWNAGKGHREGLATDQQGQTFHKIIGYHYTDPHTIYGWTTRGHGVIGNVTPESVVTARTKKANYEGYFYSNAVLSDRGDVGAPIGIRGGLLMTADFDNQTISGSSTSFEMEQGAGNFVKQNRTVSFGTAEIKDYQSYGIGQGSLGHGYKGTITSDFAPLNGGSYEGRFFGGNAQETAGTIGGGSRSVAVEGFFTAVEKR